MGFAERLISAGIAAIDFHLERFWREYAIGIPAVLVFGWSCYGFFLAPPPGYPAGAIITIKEGSPLPAIAEQLYEERLIAHRTEFTLVVRALGGATRLKAGAYRFAAPENLVTVAWRLIAGDTDIVPVRIIFPEGMTARQMSALVEKTFPQIPADDFLAAAGPYEGYLFPDTYAFLPTMTPDDMVARMRANFDAKVGGIESEIAASGHSLSDIVIMASLVEREARTSEDRRLVAGVLWNRIEKGMPLQVDAVFGYIYGRSTYSPSFEDLVTDSPYNTYEHKGLPPGPIANPGLDAILAAAHPTESGYLYYLTGRDGRMRYATTFAEHQANRKDYLD